jgi:hypothetical protein
MDPVEQINASVQRRVEGLGTEIIRFTEQKQSISEDRGLSEADRTEKIGAAADVLRQKMDTVFGKADDSIISDLQRILETSGEQSSARKRALAATEVWRRELPGLRRFLEYCTGMIAEHPDKISPDVRESQKCLTEATCVLERISALVEDAVTEK